MDLTKALNWRYAAKKLLPDRLVPEEKIERILEAARKAPSSKNLQPWKMIVISDKPFQQKLQAISHDQEKIGTASHVVVFSALRQFPAGYAEKLAEKVARERQQTPEEMERHLESIYRSMNRLKPEAVFRRNSKMVFLALGFLLLAAALEEVDAGPMDGFDREKVNELLGLTGGDYSAVVMVALGYRDPADKYSHLVKVRFDESDVVERRP